MRITWEILGVGIGQAFERIEWTNPGGRLAVNVSVYWLNPVYFEDRSASIIHYANSDVILVYQNSILMQHIHPLSL